MVKNNEELRTELGVHQTGREGERHTLAARTAAVVAPVHTVPEAGTAGAEGIVVAEQVIRNFAEEDTGVVRIDLRAGPRMHLAAAVVHIDRAAVVAGTGLGAGHNLA